MSLTRQFVVQEMVLRNGNLPVLFLTTREGEVEHVVTP